jgi:hypothetical protein
MKVEPVPASFSATYPRCKSRMRSVYSFWCPIWASTHVAGKMIDTTIDKSETIRRADHRIDFEIENGSAMYRDTGDPGKVSFPCVCEWIFNGGKNNVHWCWRFQILAA